MRCHVKEDLNLNAISKDSEESTHLGTNDKTKF